MGLCKANTNLNFVERGLPKRLKLNDSKNCATDLLSNYDVGIVLHIFDQPIVQD